ncbi:uncharacterized protein LOC105703680 isoform X2 [Orussus abietinus]|nr:uncharacterized protein LOC105703680 isoform X2 [Orussus abietinus]XP_023287825.1 uncharacterized protein LOC105703680 isoform X2 [Orussus abietinus]
MRFSAIQPPKARKRRLPEYRKTVYTERRFTRKEIAELLFENCAGCERMAAIPQAAFAACKIRQSRERNFISSKMAANESSGSDKGNGFNCKPSNEGMELTPLKYNSKLMNSIWGLYNRYSVHNFKKNTDANDGDSAAAWGVFFTSRDPKTMKEETPIVATAAVKTSRVLTTGNPM